MMQKKDTINLLIGRVSTNFIFIVICIDTGGGLMSNKLIDTIVIAKSIKTLRLKSHLTQSDLADDIGYSARNIRRIETNGTTSIDVINTFAEYFNVSAIDILNGCFYFV